jgi:hypothetical protein
LCAIFTAWSIHGLVAHSLEVGVDLDDGDDQPEVRGEGLLEREKFHAGGVNGEVRLVDLFLDLIDFRDLRGVAGGQGLGGRRDRVLHVSSHGQELFFELS